MRWWFLLVLLSAVAFAQAPSYQPGPGGAAGSSTQGFSTVTFSATPTFDATGGVQTFKITLTGNVTSSTFSNGTTGQFYSFIVCQDSTGSRAFVPPTSMHQYGTWMATPSNCVTQTFAYDGTNLNAVAPWTADTRPFTANAMDDEFDSNTFNVSTLWTWVNQGTAAITESNGVARFAGQTGTTAFRFLEQALPVAPWEFTTKVYTWNSANFSHCGLGIRESGTAKAAFIGPIYNDGGSSPTQIFGGRYTNNTTQSGTIFSLFNPVLSPVYLRINRTGTTLTYSHSYDGLSYMTDGSEAITVSFTTAPDQVGLHVDAEGSAVLPVCSYDWFRRTQ